MEKYSIQFQEVKQIVNDNYPSEQFSVARMKYLSNKPNAHGFKISEEVLRANAATVLGKFVVADMTGIVDARGHTDAETIMGYIPAEQEVEFEYDDIGYLWACVDAVISKAYAYDFCAMFDGDNERSVSVEMTVAFDEIDKNKVTAFDIYGVTVLGHMVNPSVPNANIVFTRFSEEEAKQYFAEFSHDSLTVLKQFAEERKAKMAESKTYKIDKSKEAVSDTPWGEVDKTALRNKIMSASNRDALVKACYMLIKDGWQDAPSEKLKYPVMQIKGDTLVYNKGGLSSALGYAKKENETAVVNKIEKIYKKLELDSSGKEEDAKMENVEFAANIGNLWCKLYDMVNHSGCEYCIEGIYEEDGQKFVVIIGRDDCMFRVNFTIDGSNEIVFEDDKIPVEKEFVPSERTVKFSEPEDVEKFKKFSDDEDEDDKDEDKKDDPEDEDDDDGKDDEDDKDAKMSYDELEAKCAQMQKDIEDRDNIIMNKDAELAELRTFKEGVETKEKAMAVESVMSEVKDFMAEDQYKQFREEGLACKMSELDGWKNKVKAVSFEKLSKSKAKKDFWSFSAPVDNTQTVKGLWD